MIWENGGHGGFQRRTHYDLFGIKAGTENRKSGGTSTALGVNRPFVAQGKPPHSIDEDGGEVSKDRVTQRVIAVNDNYVVILIGVAN